MYHLIIRLFFILLTNSLIYCVNNNDNQNPNSNSTIEITADKKSYNPGTQVVISVNITKTQESYKLRLACDEKSKCEKVFNCSDHCSSDFEVKKQIEEQIFAFKLNPLVSGHVTLFLTNITNDTNYPDLSRSFVRISVGQSYILDVLSGICGWIYFVSWSVSFYPQIFLNFKRKSVIGLNFDFIALNVTGFFFYSIFNLAMFYVDSVQNEYFSHNPFSLIPVEKNDVVFAVHAFLVSVITLIQCFCIYDRGNQTISNYSIGLLTIFWSIAVISTIVLTFDKLNVLIYLYMLSYIKLIISFIKYIPQAYFNYQRKSTTGWSIENILLDLTGGFFSLVQICLINFNYDDWGNIKGNLTKFGLGILSMSFDFLFIIQHYILYRNNDETEKVQNSDSETDSSNQNRD